jgi:hypothetical protein
MAAPPLPELELEDELDSDDEDPKLSPLARRRFLARVDSPWSESELEEEELEEEELEEEKLEEEELEEEELEEEELEEEELEVGIEDPGEDEGAAVILELERVVCSMKEMIK